MNRSTHIQETNLIFNNNDMGAGKSLGVLIITEILLEIIVALSQHLITNPTEQQGQTVHMTEIIHEKRQTKNI